ALVAADRRGNEGRPEYRALEIVIEKLKKIQKESGSVGRVLPNFASGRVGDVLPGSVRDAEEELERLLEDGEAEEANEHLTRLTLRNRDELRMADEYVDRLGTIDDFRPLLEPLLKTTFHGWDDGGALTSVGDEIVTVTIPRRLRDQLATTAIDRATFGRLAAVESQEAGSSGPVEFLTPAHPLVAAVLRSIRDEARDPGFPHRFDVASDAIEGLVCSFVARYVDGESRTVDERLDAVQVSFDGAASTDPESDMGRLGVGDAGAAGSPDPERIDEWRDRYTDLVPAAKEEAARRATLHRGELDRIADEIIGEERESLARWKYEERDRIEKITLGTGQVTFDQAEAYDARLKRLEDEYERRLDALRDRSSIRLSSLELIG
ncbi:MAG: hypothetical protein GY704_00705, partial [Phycisphaeraceae bacterium]|nr:hypothetical protein [Phycisphaeraceae bacterium]